MRDKNVESFSEAKGSNTKQQRLEAITQNIPNKKHTNQTSDIPEQKQVDDTLRESEAKMRSILEHIGIGVALISPRMEILELNARMREWFPTINPDQHPICYQAFNNPPYEEICNYCPTCKTLQDGLVHESTTQTPHEGGVRNYRIISSPIFNRDGDITAAVEMVEDITERKQAEEKILRSDQRLRLHHEQSPLGFLEWDENFCAIEWNTACERIFGYTKEEAIGRHAKDLILPPNVHEMVDDIYLALMSQNSVHHNINENVTKDGRIIICEWFCTTLIDKDGKAIGVASICRDITEEKQAEQEHMEYLRFMENMDRINRAIQGKDDLGQMMSDVLDEVMSIFNCDRAWLVYPCDPEAASWCAPMERTKPQYPGANALGLEVPIDSDVIRVFSTVLGSDGPVQFHSQSEHALPVAVAKQFNEQSQIAMAIYPKGDKPYMFGLHQCSYPRTWTPQEEKLLKEIGRRLEDGLTSLLMYRDLKEKENKYRELADSITDIFFAMDKNLRFTYWNKASEKNTGIQAEDALGKTHQEIFPDMPWAKRVEKIYRNVLEARQPRTFINEIDQEGESLVHEIFAYPSISGISVFIKDITQRKKAQEALETSQVQLSQALKIAKIGYWEYDFTDRMFTFNDQFYSVYRTSAEKVGGYKMSLEKYAQTFLYPEDARNLLENMQKLNNGIDTLENVRGEHRIKFGDGKTGYVSVIFYIDKKDDKGRVTKIYGANQDITEQQQAQEALKESEIRYRELFKNMTSGVAVYEVVDGGKDFIFRDFNHAAEKYDKQSREVLIGKSIFDVRPNIEEFGLIDAFRKALKTNKPVHHPIKFYKDERITGWYDNYIYPLPSGEIVAVFDDVTEKKQTLEAMRKSEERLRLMTETIEDAFWMSTPGMKEMRYISSSYEKIWGRTCKSLYENPKSFLETIHPEDRNILLDILKNYHEPGKQYSCEYRIVPSQGKFKWISERGYPVFDESGNLRYMTGVCSDITNYKLAEEALKDSKHRLKKQAFLTKTLLDSFPCIAMLLRPETREIVTSNKAAVEVGAVSGKTCFEAWAQRSKPCPWCLAPKVWKEGETQHLEVEYMGIAWDAYWVPVSDDLYMHFAFDITERKQIEKRVFEYQKQLKSLASQLTLVEEKERYRIATELHDHIGQYLAVSSMKLKEIRQLIDSEEAQSILESVCEWLNHVIEETRSLTFNLSSPILYELGFERAVAAWLKDEIEKKHNIETVFETDELPKLLDDNVRILLFRSVRELLFNIVRHAQAKKVNVSIGTSNGDIKVKIQDNGIGFDYTDVLEAVGVKTKFGLFSIRERLEHFGGRMQIDSTPGQGTIIKLFAPLKRI